MSLKSTTLIAAASAGLLASPLLAQDAVRQATGYFADEKDPDLLVLRDDGSMTFHFHVAAFVFEYDFKYPTGSTAVHDVVCKPASSGVDSFVWTGDGGLYESTYVSGNPTQLFAHTAISAYAGTPWDDADRVLIPEDGSTNTYVGLDRSAAELFVCSSGLTATYTTYTSPLDYTLADWDGDGDDDIVTVHNWGVLVQAINGTVLDTASFAVSTWTDLRCARVRESGSARDIVAIVGQISPSTTTYVGVYGDLVTEPLTSLSDYEGLEFAVADLDDDGNDDLALTIVEDSAGAVTEPIVLALYNDVGGASDRFHEGESAEWTPAGTVGPDSAFDSAPALIDFYRDGEIDACLWGIENGNAVPVVIENPETDLADYRVDIAATSATLYSSPDAVDLHLSTSMPSLALSSATHLHVEWWTMSINPTTLEISVEPAGLGVQSYAHGGPTTSSVVLDVPEDCLEGYAFIRVWEAIESGGTTTARGPASWRIVSVDRRATEEYNDDLVFDEFGLTEVGGDSGGAGNGSNSDDPPRPPGSGNGSGGGGGAGSGG